MVLCFPCYPKCKVFDFVYSTQQNPKLHHNMSNKLPTSHPAKTVFILTQLLKTRHIFILINDNKETNFKFPRGQ